MSTQSHNELLEAMRTPCTTGALMSALATCVIGTNSLEGTAESDNPDAAQIIAKLGNRLITLAHKMGHPVQPV